MDTSNSPATTNEPLWLLAELTGELSTASDLENVQRILSRGLRWLFDFDRCTLAVRITPTDDRFQLLEIGQLADGSELSSQELPFADNWPSRLLMEGKPYYLDNLTQLPATVKPPADPTLAIGEAACSAMLLPLQFQGRVVGSLHFSSTKAISYTFYRRNLGALLATHLAGKLGSLLASPQVSSLLAYPGQFENLAHLSNRRQFEKRLQPLLERAQQQGQIVAVLMLGLSRFKPVNATFGYEAETALLEEITARLQSCVYESDLIMHLDGDEFALALTRLKTEQGAGQVAQKLLAALRPAFSIMGQPTQLNTSLGISLFPAHSENAKELIYRANLALRFAQEQNQGDYLFFNSRMKEASEDLTIAGCLRQALARNELMLRYQPQVALADGKIVGVEALVRWQHPELGLVSPAKFIPLAEETGLIIPIGTWILEEACRQGRAWQQAGYAPVKMSVNVSALQFQQPDFVETVCRVLEKTNLDPAYLELELTESMLIHNYQDGALKLETLRQKGIKVAIDDFGTGYSSLSYLQNLPADILKIDRSFIQSIASQLASSSKDRVIIQAIITLAHNLGMQVVAEGVELKGQEEFLQQIGCDIMQGYLFSAPLNASEVEALFKQE